MGVFIRCKQMQETLKCSVDLLDMLGLYVVLTKLLGRSEMKVMIIAVGNGLQLCVSV